MYNVPDQSGRYVVITGANSGTGKEAAKRIAAAGGHVVIAVRSPEKGEAARTEILAAAPGATVDVKRLDLAEQASVHAFAEELIAAGRPVDTLINNAGVMAVPKRMTTVDGFELQLATNFLGPFALTNLLLPLILESPTPRVATMSSFVSIIGKIRFDDLQFTRGYSPYRTYGQSKLADMLLGLHLAAVATERDWPLISTIAHPGFTRTNLQSSGPNLGKSKPRSSMLSGGGSRFISQDVEQGAEPLLYAATSPDAEQGAYYGPSGPGGLTGPTTRTKLPRSAYGIDLAASLWAVAEEITGTRLPEASDITA